MYSERPPLRLLRVLWITILMLVATVALIPEDSQGTPSGAHSGRDPTAVAAAAHTP